MGEFTHFNEQGHAVMVDVSEKSDTVREATAMGRISMSQECFEKVKTGGMKKGDVLGTARIAGIMGAKRTSELIPLCHILNLSKVMIEFEYMEAACEIEARCTAKTVGSFTGLSTTRSAIALPERVPKRQASNSELPPRRFAPCTDTQEHSPAANRPSTTARSPSTQR